MHKQLKNYQRMKLLTGHWVDLATELTSIQPALLRKDGLGEALGYVPSNQPKIRVH